MTTEEGHMSTIDRIRATAQSRRDAWIDTVSIDAHTAEALCDLANAAESFLHDDQQPGEATREPMRAALDRLNSEEGI